MLAEPGEEIYLEARRHGIVLARPLIWAVVLAGGGGVLITLPWPVSVAGAAVVAIAAGVALRAVRLAAVEAVELEQSFPGQLLGYGTVVVGPLALEHVPRPKRLYHLLDRLAG